MEEQQLNVLPSDYELHWYRIERVLGQGGFGITYLARDNNLDQLVAIKEYLPAEFAVRAANDTVQPRSENHEEKYRWGLDRLINEAQTLAKFDHPSIVKVNSVFEYNNTAYIVMRYERGENLQSVLKRRKTLEEGEVMEILLPILDGLEQVHRCGFIHRDIKPDNIYIRQDGTPVLLDFGSARQALGNNRTLTILVAPGYAPFEQYHSNTDQQGPWTDIYGLGATLYRAIAGDLPIDAMTRSKGLLGSTRDVLVLATDIGRGRYSQKFLEAIDHALAFNERDRPQTIADWRLELCAGIAPASGGDETPAVERENRRPSLPRYAAQEGTQTPEPPRSDTTTHFEADVPAAGPEHKQRSGQPKAVYSVWARTGVVVAFIVLLSLLGILVVREMQDQTERDQLMISRQEIEGQDNKLQENKRQLVIRQQELGAREKKLLESGQQLVIRQQALEDREETLLENERQFLILQQELEDQDNKLEENKRQLVIRQQALGNREKKLLESERQQKEEQKGIVTGYIELANQALARHEFDKAQRHLDRAAAIEPAAESVASARARLIKARNASEAVPEFENGEAVESTITIPPSVEQDLAIAITNFKRGDYKNAVGKLRPLAEINGMLEAKYYVGLMYDTGKGVPRDDAEAVKWYRRAAEQGYDPAQNAMGVMYAQGRGVARDDRAALEWYRRAAAQCNTDAQTDIGNMYAEGRGTAQSDFQAYAWYEAAAAAGSKIAKERRDAIAKKLQPVELEQASKLAQRHAQCKKAEG
ncbi:MAG: protein kinase [Gammaproteobacteria bacterium]|nr:protein kinase [Gammaproteobacteria bacterium]